MEVSYPMMLMLVVPSVRKPCVLSSKRTQLTLFCVCRIFGCQGDTDDDIILMAA